MIPDPAWFSAAPVLLLRRSRVRPKVAHG